MAYQSLYRKYRPQTFSDVIGQEHVVRTLQNAIAAERIAHGYLFTGTRGTAKTTIARLVAKALNCLAGEGPVAEPCNNCDACRSIMQGSCIDVIEMDAASHRGVADIEEVRKAVGYGAMQFRYKVFIIDEAHQLSSDAKDAFLKTLEEPPPGVVFILATTEPQAIPITIRSRCQQFDFKRGSLADISKRLKYVLDCEGVAYAPEAINLVARGAEGSYRDSLSLLEQVLAFAPKKITAADVEMVLGALDSEQLARVTECVAHRDAPGALALAGEILDSGKEARTLLKTLAAHFRDLLLVSVGGPAAANELAPEDVARLQVQARYFTPPQILKAIDLLNEAQGETRWNNQHRLLTELTFLKLMTLGDAPDQPLATAPIVFSHPMALTPSPSPHVPPASGLSGRGETEGSGFTPSPKEAAKNEQTLGEGAGGEGFEDDEEEPVLAAALQAGYFADDETLDEEDEFVPVVVEPEPAPVSAPVPSGLSLFDDDDTPAAPSAPANDGLSLFDVVEEVVVPAPAPAPPAPTPEPKVVVVEAVTEDEDYPPLPEDEFAPTALFDEPAVVPVVPVAPVRPVPTPEPTREPEPEPELELIDPRITLTAVQRAWPAFLAQAEKISKKTSVMMSAAIPVDVEGRTVVLSFTARMNHDMMNAPKQQEFVRKLLAKVLAPDLGSVPVRFVLDENVPPPPQRAVARQTVRRDPLAQIEDLKQEHLRDENAPAPAPWTPPVVQKSGVSRPAERPENAPRPRFGASEPAPPPDLGERAESGALAAPGSRKAQALAEPLVQDILSTFGGELVEE